MFSSRKNFWGRLLSKNKKMQIEIFALRFEYFNKYHSNIIYLFLLSKKLFIFHSKPPFHLSSTVVSLRIIANTTVVVLSADFCQTFVTHKQEKFEITVWVLYKILHIFISQFFIYGSVYRILKLWGLNIDLNYWHDNPVNQQTKQAPNQ